jgi:hypothetical protein
MDDFEIIDLVAGLEGYNKPTRRLAAAGPGL